MALLGSTDVGGQPALRVQSGGTHELPDQAGKLTDLQVGNFFIISFNELIAEGMTLGEKNGISRAHTAAFLEKFFPGPVHEGCAAQLLLCMGTGVQ